MIIRARGYNTGFAEYLRTGLKAGNKFHRDQLDERFVLLGDLDTSDKIVNAMQDTGNDRYLHLTLSFKEDYIPIETLKEIATLFKRQLMNAYHEEEYDFYAESHLPKIKRLLNESTGALEERKPHIHVIIPKVNMIDGSYLNPLGYYPHNVKYVEAIQETINAHYGLASPRDNRRTQITDISDFISRHKGDFFKADARRFKENLLVDILSDKNINYLSFLAKLHALGEVKTRNGKNEAYLNVKPDGQTKGINLKEFIFTQKFLDLSHEKKQEYVLLKGYTRTSEQKSTDLLNDESNLKQWLEWRSHEIKFLHPGSKERKKYSKMSMSDKRMFLDGLIDLHRSTIHDYLKSHDSCVSTNFNQLIVSSIKDKYHVRRKNSDQESRIPGNARIRRTEQDDSAGSGIHRYSMRKLQFSDLDSSFYETPPLFLQATAREDLGGKLYELSNTVRCTIGGNNSRAERRVNIDDVRSPGVSETRWNTTDEVQTTLINISPLKRRADNYVESVRVNVVSDRKQQIESTMVGWKELQANLSAFELLKSLTSTHGIDKEKYFVVKAKDGSDRIKCQTRNYSVNDFLTKELNMSWPEANDYLRKEYSRQKQGALLKTSSTPYLGYWHEFKLWESQPGNSIKEQWQYFREQQKKRKVDFYKSFRIKSREVWGSNLSRSQKRATIAVLRLTKLKELAQLEGELLSEKKTYKEKLQTRHRYTDYLIERSTAGDPYALEELRRFTYQENQKNPQGNYIDHGANAVPCLFANVSYTVHLNGVVSYLIGGRVVVQDTQEWVSVVETENEEAIVLAIKLALDKNGNKALTLNGNIEFQTQVLSVAINNNLSLSFTNDALQKRYQQLVKEREENLSSPESTPSRSTKPRKG